MAVRTQSSFARATISSGRIRASEERRLQRAIRQIEDSLNTYNEEVGKAKDKKSRFGFLAKAGNAFSSLGALTANPLIGGIGLIMTGYGARGEYLAAEGLEKEANKLETEAAKQLGDLLFVGQEATDVTKGAGEFKTIQQDAAETFKEGALWEGLLKVGTAAVTAGQAGTLGSGMKNFLNTKLIDTEGLSKFTGEGASEIQKLGAQYLESQAPSIGSLLGGVTPYEQEVYGGYLKKKAPGVFDWEKQKQMGYVFTPSNSITDGTTSEALKDITTDTGTETVGEFAGIEAQVNESVAQDIDTQVEGVNVGRDYGENITSKESYSPSFVNQFESEYSQFGDSWDEIIKEFNRSTGGGFSDWSNYQTGAPQGETILDMTNTNVSTNPMAVDPDEFARIRARIAAATGE